MNMHVKQTAKFKSGDIVTVSTNYDGLIVGNRYTIKDEARKTTHRWWNIVEQRNHRTNDGSFREDMLSLAPKFAVGDKVRALVDGLDVTKGATYEVARVDDDGVAFRDDDFDMHWIAFEDIELVVAAASNTNHTSCAAAEVDNLADEYGGRRAFKVGDRVKVDWPHEMWVGEATVAEVDNGIVIVNYDNGKTGGFAHKHLTHVAVAPATATLTIQAGRYYKTRDGRKVGPMERYNRHPDFPWTVGHPFSADLGKAWRSDGSFDIDLDERHDADLIAERSDDVPLRGVSPVVAPATTAKFKVGDRVKRTHGYFRGMSVGDEAIIAGVDGEVRGLHFAEYGDGHEHAYFEVLPQPTTMADIVRKHSGTAVVMLIENGQPKPATRPYVHDDRVAATTEAERLATTMPGSEFGVYELVTRRVADVVVREVA